MKKIVSQIIKIASENEYSALEKSCGMYLFILIDHINLILNRLNIFLFRNPMIYLCF